MEYLTGGNQALVKRTLMNYLKYIFIAGFFLGLTSTQIWSQDNRTVDTKVADLLVIVPAKNQQQLNRQMVSMLELEEAGLQKIFDLIIPPGTGDDTRPRMAVESLSRYLSQNGMETEKHRWESMVLAEIDKRENPDIRGFLIAQLYYIGSRECIEQLGPYLANPLLYDQAIRAMRAADPRLASETFVEYLDKTLIIQQIALINAIANIGNPDHAAAVAALSNSNEQALQRSVLACLAKLGNLESYELMMNAAKANLFMPEPTNATGSLLFYAQTLSEQGRRNLSLKICKTIDKKCFKPEQIHFKASALITAAGNDTIAHSVSLLAEAMKNENREYRMAAVNYAAAFQTPVEPWIIALNKSKNNEVKCDILYLFGILKKAETSAAVRSYLSNQDPQVRKQAVESIALIEQTKALGDLIRYSMDFPTPPDTETAKAALLQTMESDQINTLVYYLKEAPEGAKVVFTEVIAAKGDPEVFQILYNQCNQDGPVGDASIKNLHLVSSGANLDDLITLFDLLENEDEQKHIEKALIASINSSPDKEIATKKVIVHASNQSLINRYIFVMAAVGGKQALSTVYAAYLNSEGEHKKRAFEALVQSSDIHALNPLFEICTDHPDSSEKEMAFASYARIVHSSNLPDDQKLLLLRKIEPLSPTQTSSMLLINAMGGVKTFLSFVTLSAYLEDETLQLEAANALIRVGLPSQGQDNGLEGALVKETLARVSQILSGPESEYTRIDIENYLKEMSDHEGFVSMFNGKDLSGWQGLASDPVKKKELSEDQYELLLIEANEKLKENWSVKDNCIVFNGEGSNLCSIKEYTSFEMVVDWRITKKGDSGIYLRGSPQVQIWDTARVEAGAEVGSGGLYNNQIHESKPLLVADNPIGDWNTFRITMIDEQVSVYLNGQMVVDHVILENYWDRSIPIYPEGSIELQAHGTDLAFRNIYVRELEPAWNTLTAEEQSDGFISLFNGSDLSGWTGEDHSYRVENGNIVIRPNEGGGNLYTDKEYSDFVFRFEFKLTPGANNGLGIRTPLTGNPAYVGYELQILDNTAEVFKNLEPYQYHGSVYGIIPAKRGFLKPVGEWNSQEVMVKGDEIRINLNGTIIVEGNLKEASVNGTADGEDHPGLKRSSGHIGFLGHGSLLWFRNIRIKEL